MDDASDDDDRADDALDDGVEVTTHDTDDHAASPLDAFSDAEIEAKLATSPSSLGTISLGSIHAGGLLFGVPMPQGPYWEVVSPPQSIGAQETVDALAQAIEAVNKQFPGSPKAFIGDISRQGGGHFSPHVSHQAGRDVDMSYYLAGDMHHWYVTANAKNLDLPRTWALVKALITGSDVELLLMDKSVQRLVKDYAKSIGEDTAWLDDIFQVDGKSKQPIIIHVPGHASHIHVRFWAAESRELGRRAYAYLLKNHLIKPPTYFVDHVVAKGETLASIATKFHVSIAALKRANHLASSRISRGRTLKIPRTGGVERQLAKIVAPPRRLPPVQAIAQTPPPPPLADNPCAHASR
jgi:penicillin-insensitive murein endopeptidase